MKLNPIPTLWDESDKKRFWSKVDIKGPEDCWPWLAYRQPSGYGKFGLGYKILMAHRVAFYLTYNFDPETKIICHSCDNPACCNPKHMKLGDHKFNAKEASERGLLATGERAGVRAHPEAYPAKLTKEDVQEIRARYAEGYITQVQLAEQFKVRQCTISAVIRGKLYPREPNILHHKQYNAVNRFS